MIEAETLQPARPVVYFHIGAPKTGTTYLQRILWNNRVRLEELGVRYPGDTFRAHVHAAFDLRNAGFHGYQDPNVPGAWARFVEAARNWDGPIVFSQGLFGPATRQQVRRAMDDLAFAEVHLICTARELSRQVPASWEEDVKNRFGVGFGEFVAALRDPREDGHGLGKMFWRLQDLVEVLARWSWDVPADRVHIVTVPPRGEDTELWPRFAQVIGVDPHAVDLSVPYVNASLGAAEAMFLARLNRALDDEVGWPLYSEMVKNYLADGVLANRPDSARLVISEADAEWFARRGAAMVASLSQSGYDVVGSLDDLLAPPVDVGSAESEPSAQDQYEVAIEALASLLLRLSRLRRKVIEPRPDE